MRIHLTNMNRILCTILLVVFVNCFVNVKSATRKADRNNRGALSIGGKLVGDSDARWQVSIMKDRKLFCGGSLIRNNVVLTAAECVKDIEPADLLVRAGTKSFKKGGQIRKVRETVHHPEYKSDTHAYNVGVLLLMRPFNTTADTISRIKLPDENSELPSSISVYGWGMSRSRSNVTMTKNLRFSKSKVYSAKKCAQFLTETDAIENVFCTGDRVKRADICNDDLGSPAVENETQLGIVSADGACSESHTTIYTNLMPHKTWILNTLQEFKSSNRDKPAQENPINQS